MNRFAQTLRAQDRLAIAQFGGEFKLLRKSFSRAQESIAVTVQPNDAACAGTDFYGALDRALDELKDVKGRKGAVILTDGEHGEGRCRRIDQRERRNEQRGSARHPGQLISQPCRPPPCRRLARQPAAPAASE
jgi:hypothetical protein